MGQAALDALVSLPYSLALKKLALILNLEWIWHRSALVKTALIYAYVFNTFRTTIPVVLVFSLGGVEVFIMCFVRKKFICSSVTREVESLGHFIFGFVEDESLAWA